MKQLNFDNSQLMNLDYSLRKRIHLTNSLGTYLKTSVVFCNTLRNDGLFVCRIPEIDDDKHVLLSALDESIICKGFDYNLGTHQYPGVIYPDGYKYITQILHEPLPTIDYAMGAVELTKQVVLAKDENILLFKYTLREGFAQTTLRLLPYFAFRSINALNKANPDIKPIALKVPNGLKIKLYDDYPYLFLQASCDLQIKPYSNWFYNMEYREDDASGTAYTEDLLAPSYFEIELHESQSLILAVSLFEINPAILDAFFTQEATRTTKTEARNPHSANRMFSSNKSIVYPKQHKPAYQTAMMY